MFSHRWELFNNCWILKTFGWFWKCVGDIWHWWCVGNIWGNSRQLIFWPPTETTLWTGWVDCAKLKKRLSSSLWDKLPNENGRCGTNSPVEEEEEVEAEGVDDGGHHGGEEHHGAAPHQLCHRGSHVPIWMVVSGIACCMVFIGIGTYWIVIVVARYWMWLALIG